MDVILTSVIMIDHQGNWILQKRPQAHQSLCCFFLIVREMSDSERLSNALSELWISLAVSDAHEDALDLHAAHVITDCSVAVCWRRYSLQLFTPHQ